jgi:hypothetical protein
MKTASTRSPAWEQARSAGSVGSAWTLQRADFAVTQGQVVNLRIAVNQGHTNADTVWVQTATDLATTSGTVNSAITAGDSVTFSGALGLVYKNGTSTWLTASINGASQANLPLQLIQVNDDGSQTVIDHDLGSVTSDALTALGGDGASLVDDPLYLYYQSLADEWTVCHRADADLYLAGHRHSEPRQFLHQPVGRHAFLQPVPRDFDGQHAKQSSAAG